MLIFVSSCLGVFFPGCSRTDPKQGRVVNLYTWSNYIPDRVLRKFEPATGIHLNYDTYDSNEALLEKVQSGVADYDVIVPSDYMVGILSRAGLLRPLDRARVSNIRNVGSRFLDAPYDPKNVYSAPFLWATTGIAYNSRKVTEVVDSWAILWNPKYAGRTLMLDDMRECFSAALRWKGHSLNSTNAADLEEAKQQLMIQKPLLKAYNSTNFEELLASGDVWIAHGWSGQFASLIQQNPDLAYVVPKEGGPIAIENLAIPKSARHVDEAHELIQWLLDARVGAEITNLSGYPNSNEAARAFIRPDILKDPVIYPDEATLSRCELISDIGATSQILDRYWTEIKSH